MKKGIFIISISIVLLGLSIWESISVSNIINYLFVNIEDLLPQYIENKDNISSLDEKLNEISEFWFDRECTLCIMFNHKDLSVITDGLNRLKSYTKYNQYEDAMVELYLLESFTSKAEHIMGFNIHNVL